MKNITLRQAYELIQQSAAVVIDGDALAYPSLDGLTGDPNNEWMNICWRSYEGAMNGITFRITFIEEDQTITFDGSTITMQDSEGIEVSLTLLVMMQQP